MKGMTETDKLLVRIGTARDAISRKTEQTSLDYMIDGVLMNCSVLLKEQEAVEPNPVHNSYRWFACGKCDCSITREDRFCPRCGRAVKWE